MLKAGTIVTVMPTAEALRQSYPAVNQIIDPTIVRLLDPIPNENTLDVIDVKTMDFWIIYDFNIFEVNRKVGE